MLRFLRDNATWHIAMPLAGAVHSIKSRHSPAPDPITLTPPASLAKTTENVLVVGTVLIRTWISVKFILDTTRLNAFALVKCRSCLREPAQMAKT